MPPGKTNPPHMHFTAEVFICTKGRWDLQWGFNPEPLKAQIGPGDIASVPTWIYRGFQNVGDDEGFMFTALGQNDTGGILWGPQTLQAAREQGVHLTEDYRIIDEQLGHTWDEQTMRRLQPMTPQEISQLRRWTPEQMGQRVVRHAELQWSSRALLDAALPGCGAQLAPVIGLGLSQDRDQQAPIGNAHGFSIEWLKIPVGGQVSLHRLACQQVLTVHPVPHDLATGHAVALRPLVLMMREAQVDSAGMNVDGVAEQAQAHGTALGMPAREAGAPRGVPHQLGASRARLLP
jgi:hypothetical protein